MPPLSKAQERVFHGLLMVFPRCRRFRSAAVFRFSEHHVLYQAERNYQGKDNKLLFTRPGPPGVSH